MKISTEKYLNDFFCTNQNFFELKQQIIETINAIITVAHQNKKILICGNGGSSADCEHIAGELLKSFTKKRPLDKTIQSKLIKKYNSDGKILAETLQCGIKCIPLTSFNAYNTAFINDCNAELLFAQLVNVLGDENDILIGISTSGNSTNICQAFKMAKIKGLKTISLTGKSGGKLKNLSDILINADNDITYKVQEAHIRIYHLICLCVENELFDV